jgi:hypothetical protein
MDDFFGREQLHEAGEKVMFPFYGQSWGEGHDIQAYARGCSWLR